MQENSFTEEIISGWGRYLFSKSKLYIPSNKSQIEEIIFDSPSKSTIARGMGRSYGNPAQMNFGNVINFKLFNNISIDYGQSKVTVGGGVTFDNLLKKIVPNGFFVPVSPGTRFVTVGGAIAADVHGKNHHIDGSFCNFVDYIKLIDGRGKQITLSPYDSEKSKYFWATCGGMGLTGLIIEAKFSLIPIETSFMNVVSQRIDDLDTLMHRMKENDAKYKYNVAWIDSLNVNGRGVITSGEHALENEINNYFSKEKLNLLKYESKAIANTPNLFPRGILNRLTVKIFNEAWFRKVPKNGKNSFETISSFFHPLDAIENWNKIYGPKGFLQYQFVVPDSSAYLISRTLDKLRKIGAPSFLTVLKRFGNSNPGYLSFPMKGWTLAADVPISTSGLFEVLNDLDQEISKSGGRLYLAKDSRQSEYIFKKTYPRYSDWIEIKSEMDPEGKFYSDLAQRIGI